MKGLRANRYTMGACADSLGQTLRVSPPSTRTAVPLMYAACREHRKTAAAAHSSTVPSRPDGTLSLARSYAASSEPAVSIMRSVAIWPGWT